MAAAGYVQSGGGVTALNPAYVVRRGRAARPADGEGDGSRAASRTISSRVIEAWPVLTPIFASLPGFLCRSSSHAAARVLAR
jgi:hypothetical protein